MLNLYDLLHEILNVDVSPSDVIDAIKNKYQVIITYSDEKNRAPKKRLIEPYVYGLSKAGNNVIRAYQYEGDTFRGKPKWKLFRLDRVTSWQPTNSHFNTEPLKRGWNAQAYNEHGDNSMSTILNQVDLNDDNNPYMKDSDLYKLRQKTNAIKQSTPININNLKNAETNNYGPVNNTVTTQLNNMNTSEFKKMLDRNLEITKKEKEKRGFSLSNNNRGPIINKSNNNTENSNSTKVKKGFASNDSIKNIQNNLNGTNEINKQ